MRQGKLKSIFLHCFVLWFFAGFVPLSLAQESSDFSREALVRRMREAEKRAHSAEARYTVIVSGTKPNMIPLIKELCESRGKPKEVNNYVIGEEYEKMHSQRVHWMRKGEKERFEYSQYAPLNPSSGNSVSSIEAFNGKRVWNLTADPVKPRASLRTVEGAHWKTNNRSHPFSFVYSYQDMPYSQIVEKSPFFEVSEELVDGKKCTMVAVGFPKFSGIKFNLFFDENARLVQRQVLDNFVLKGEFRIGEVHRLLDWKPFENKQGSPIEFPSQANYSYCMGVSSNGTLVEYSSTKFEFEQLVFNPWISDAIFQQNIPRSAEVWDGISGMRTLEPGNRPEHLFPEDAEARWWWIKTIGISVFVGLVVSAAVIRWRNASRATC